MRGDGFSRGLGLVVMGWVAFCAALLILGWVTGA